MLRQHMPMQLPNGQVRTQSMSERSEPRSNLSYQPRTTNDDFMRDNFYTDMVFGNHSEQAMRQHRVEQKVDIRWGSDAGFGNAQGFVPPPSQESVAANERAHMHAVEQAFSLTTATVPSSADTTRASSPIRTLDRRTTEAIGQNHHEDEDSRPRKRRKSRYKEEEDDDDDDMPSTSNTKNAKKRKPSKKGSISSPAADSEGGHKRRKSAVPVPKPTRENLTEDQKRENHIKSEQKRRTLIREGFEDLNELVPGLRGGGFSKSAILIMAADWLEELMQGNQVLQARLDQLEGR